jgi:hypothetical protein
MAEETIQRIVHEQPISVNLKRNSKGVTEIEVHVHGQAGLKAGSAVFDAGSTYDQLCKTYPYTEAK